MKTVEQKEQEKREYLVKSSKHLFTLDKKTFLKVVPFIEDGKEFLMRIEIGIDGSVYTSKHDVSQYDKQGIKNIAAPSWRKVESVKYFKAMRNLISEFEKKMVTDLVAAKATLSENFKTLDIKVVTE